MNSERSVILHRKHNWPTSEAQALVVVGRVDAAWGDNRPAYKPQLQIMRKSAHYRQATPLEIGPTWVRCVSHRPVLRINEIRDNMRLGRRRFRGAKRILINELAISFNFQILQI